MKENKSEKNKLKKRIITFILLILLAGYLLYTVYLLIKQPTKMLTVENGKLYMEESDIGYIIRDEEIVQGENYKNGMEQIKNEGEKVSKNEAIFRYYSQNEEELKQKILELDEKIQTAMQENKQLFSSDMKILDNQIDEKIYELNKIKDISKLTEYNKQINELVTKKAKVAGEMSPSGSYLKQLIAERSGYEAKLNSGAEYKNAPKSGIVSYRVDGLEETLNPNNFSALNKKYFENLNLKTGKIIASSNEAGKVIDNFKCYIATISDSDNSKNAKVNDEVSIRLPNNKEIESKIVYINNEDDGSRLIILEINKEIEELINYRKIAFELIWWSKSGLKVPNQAIVEKDGLHYVVRNRAGYLNKILIKVVKQNENYSIVTNYGVEELKELGFDDKEISSYRKITLYDEIIAYPNIEKVE
ncbi:MAG: hypothetical protein IJH39_08615 [Clostridia bacterium]|nr:hypothetical protein [Clostridia bacterium]